MKKYILAFTVAIAAIVGVKMIMGWKCDISKAACKASCGVNILCRQNCDKMC